MEPVRTGDRPTRQAGTGVDPGSSADQPETVPTFGACCPDLREIEAGQNEGQPEMNAPQEPAAAPLVCLRGKRTARVPGPDPLPNAAHGVVAGLRIRHRIVAQ